MESGDPSRKRNQDSNNDGNFAVKKKRTRSTSHFEDLAADAANASEPELQFAAVQTVCKLLAVHNNKPINQVLASGILPAFVQCLSRNEHHTLQLEAAWALANIASGTSAQTMKVVDAGAAPFLIQLLMSPHEDVCEKAVWALGNIIGDGPILRNFVIELGVVQRLLSFIKRDVPISILHNVTWVIENLCRCKDPPAPTKAIQEIVHALNILVQTTNVTILTTTVRSISYLADGGNEQIQMVIDSGIVPKLIPLLSHNEVKLQRAVLRALGNIVIGTDDQMQVVVDCDALSHFPALLSHSKEIICKDALWFLSNIAAGKTNVQAVIDMGLLPKVIENLGKAEILTQKEAGWVVAHLSMSGTKEQVATLINFGVIPPFCNLLSCKDTQVISMVLKSLKTMLKKDERQAESIAAVIEKCGGLDKIRRLQSHDSLDISEMAYSLDDAVSCSANHTDEILSENIDKKQTAPDDVIKIDPTELRASLKELLSENINQNQISQDDIMQIDLKQLRASLKELLSGTISQNQNAPGDDININLTDLRASLHELLSDNTGQNQTSKDDVIKIDLTELRASLMELISENIAQHKNSPDDVIKIDPIRLIELLSENTNQNQTAPDVVIKIDPIRLRESLIELLSENTDQNQSAPDDVNNIEPSGP